jgi:hypothetical protein
MPAIKEKTFLVLREYCRYKDHVELGDLIPCNHPKNKKGCTSGPCPLMKELETLSKLTRVGGFSR